MNVYGLYSGDGYVRRARGHTGLGPHLSTLQEIASIKGLYTSLLCSNITEIVSSVLVDWVSFTLLCLQFFTYLNILIIP